MRLIIVKSIFSDKDIMNDTQRKLNHLRESGTFFDIDQDYYLDEAVRDKAWIYVSLDHIKALSQYQLYIKDTDLFRDSNFGGRDNNPHITILYGLEDYQDSIIRPIIERYKKDVKYVTIGNIKRFERNGYDVIILECISKGLEELHSALRCSLYHEYRFDDYKPHITLAYVKKGQCKDIEMMKHTLKGARIKIKDIIYSKLEQFNYRYDVCQDSTNLLQFVFR